ncbi:ABC transporter permease [Kitasatospora sp. NPDC048540]|uniref:ABC transporter permease n=1 Tax=unclassified Kitasatospora TaxID=2633591 RepID=UPI00068AD1B2|nr:ABC transporter permease [Kitasatospora sp. MBT63]
MSSTLAPTRAAARPSRLAPRGIWWLMWRQQRLSVLLWLIAVVAAAVVVPFLRAAMVDYIDSHHIAGCAMITLDPACQGDGIQQAVNGFRTKYTPFLQAMGLLLTALPAGLGLFAAGPLFSREYESGTWRLVLGQSVTRTQWLRAKLASVAVPALLGSAALMGLYRWMWAPSANFVSGVGWSGTFFGSGGPVLMATVLLALAVGATVGALVRRVVPAMGATFGVVLVLQYLISEVRPYLVPSQVRMVPRSELPNDVWGFGQGFMTSGGKRLPYDLCDSSADYADCLAKAGNAREFSDVHVAADYWPLQGVESALCLVLAAALVGFLYWRTRTAD